MSSSDDDLFVNSDEETEQETSLSKLYTFATVCVRQKSFELAKDELLYLYARFKYVSEGVCEVARPGGLFNFEAKAKWDKWKELSDTKPKITLDQARQEYIDRLDVILPRWRDDFQTDDMRAGKKKKGVSKAEKSGTFGIRMSMMAKEEAPESKNTESCFAICKNGDLNKLKGYLKNNQARYHDQSELLNQQDENEMTMLMWACDCGHMKLVEFLCGLQGVDLNCQDADGQTCLHYAASCDQIDIIKFLLSKSYRANQIDVNKKDSDGLIAAKCSQNKEIRALFEEATGDIQI